MPHHLFNEDIKRYLPQFLSGPSQDELFSCLVGFPYNIDQRFYSDVVLQEMEIVQGDGIDQALIIKWETKELFPVPAIVLSNSCDIDLSNKRDQFPFICYCPIISLQKYVDKLRSIGKDVTSLLVDIKAQRVTSIFYLPKGQNLVEDKIILLDKIYSCPHNEKTRLESKKIFSLSNYGFYMLLLKISIHFTRIRDGIDRIPNAAT